MLIWQTFLMIQVQKEWKLIMFWKPKTQCEYFNWFNANRLIDEEGIEKLLEKPVEDTEFESDIIYEQIISDIESSSDWAYKKHWLRIMTKRKKNICSN